MADLNNEEKLKKPVAAFLIRALPKWRDEGLISADAESALFARYHLDKNKASLDSGQQLIRILSFIGALMIGIGIISIVAANWGKLSVFMRCLIVTILMLLSQGAVFWGVCKENKKVLMVAPVLQTMIFGAAIGLIVQIFNLGVEHGDTLFFWTLSALALSFILRDIPTGAVAAILSLAWAIAQSVLVFDSHADFPFEITMERENIELWVRSLMPFALVAVLYGLSVYLHSQVILACLIIETIIISFFAKFVPAKSIPLFGFSVAMTIVLAMPLIKRPVVDQRSAIREWHVKSVKLDSIAWFFPLAIMYIQTFHTFSYYLKRDSMWHEQIGTGSSAETFSAYFIYIALAVFAALYILTITRDRELRRSPVWMLSFGLGVLLYWVSWALPVLGYEEDILQMVICNIVLILFGISFLMEGFVHRSRDKMWFGMLLLLILTFTRFLSIEMELLVKGLIFIVLGIATIWVGTRFDKWMRKTFAAALSDGENNTTQEEMTQEDGDHE